MTHNYQYMQEPFFVYYFIEADNETINSSWANFVLSLMQTTDICKRFCCHLDSVVLSYILRLQINDALQTERTPKNSKGCQL